MEQLKPCPFCGHDPVWRKREGEYCWSVECEACGLWAPWFSTIEQAEEHWNSRARDEKSYRAGVQAMAMVAKRKPEDIDLEVDRLLEGG